MVPASTLMYGSIFCNVTRKPRASNSAPIEAAARPLPSDETTPPVTKMYFGAKSSSSRDPLSDVCFLHGTAGERAVQPRVPHLGENARNRGTPRDPERDEVVAAQGHDSRVEPDEPVERRGDAAIAGQPEPGELDRVDVERPPARPGQRLGKLAETAPARRGEPVVGVQQTEGSGAPEPGEDDPGLGLAQDALELGGDSLARQHGIRREAQRKRLRPGRGSILGEAEPGGVSRRAEDAGRILDVRERVQHAQSAPRQVEARAERIDQAELARGELDRQRVDREIAPPQIVADPGGHHARERPRSLVALRAGGGDVDPSERAYLHRRRQESAVLDDGAAERLREAASHPRAVALDDDVEIASIERRAAPEIADEP